jgi:tetratricopeptide (TPR) repeat protein
MQNLLSPEKYIRTKARQLPINKCFINEDWGESGMANIIVSRKHSNGNLTFCVFLVDLYCLGVKDSHHYFNMPDFEFEDFMISHFEEVEIVEIDYTLAHNIIYGAVEFANDYEFRPHKSWGLTQNILEEDTDDIELIEIPFGLDDKPTVVTEKNKVPTSIVAQLERVAGPGNYTVLCADEEGTPIEEDNTEEDFDNDFNIGDSEELLKDFSEISMEELMERTIKKDPNDLENVFGLTFELYLRIMYDDDEHFEEMVESILQIEDKFDIVTDYDNEELQIIPDDKGHFIYLQKLVLEDDQKAIDECTKTIEKTPHPSYYNLLVTAYEQNELFDKADDLTIKAFELYPNDLLTRLNYGFYLYQNEKYDQLDFFMAGYDISKIDPKRKTLHITEIAGIYHLACMHYAGTNQLLKAMAFQKAYDLLYNITDKLFAKKMQLFEYLRMLQLEEIGKKIEQIMSGNK